MNLPVCSRGTGYVFPGCFWAVVAWFTWTVQVCSHMLILADVSSWTRQAVQEVLPILLVIVSPNWAGLDGVIVWAVVATGAWLGDHSIRWTDVAGWTQVAFANMGSTNLGDDKTWWAGLWNKGA